MELPPALFLDLDDTIVAYDAVTEPCWRSTCDRYARRIDGCTSERLYDVIAAYSRWYWSDPDRHRIGRMDLKAARRELVAGALREMDGADADLAREIADTYTLEREEAVVPFPGAVETLDRLRESGVRLALITNGAATSQRAKIDRFDLARRFDCIVVEGEFGCGKPDLRVYRHALDCMGLRPEQVWMVGDNLEWDVAAPQKLGIAGVWHDYRTAGLPEGSDVRPDRIIQRLGELVE